MRLIDADVLLEQMKHRRDYVGRASDAVCLVEDAPTIEAEPGIWKPASVRPEKDGKYLVLWSLGEKGDLIYDIENYGTFDDCNDDYKEKVGWWEFDNECGVLDCTEWVKYWMELPDVPEEV